MSTRSPSQPAAAARKQLSDDDRIFRDPALDAATPSDDPLVRFVGKHWRLLLILVAVYGAVWYGQIVYRQAQSRRSDRASQGYARAHESFERLLSAQRALVAAETAMAGVYVPSATESSSTASESAKEKQGKLAEQLESANKSREEARTALVEQLKIVSDEGAQYKTIAGLYGALAQAAAGEGQAAESAISPFVDWRSVKPVSGERVLAELSAYARAKIRLGLPDGKASGGVELSELASGGTYLNAAAALALASVATTDEEKGAAREIIQRVRAAHPEQTDLLNQELRRLSWE